MDNTKPVTAESSNAELIAEARQYVILPFAAGSPVTSLAVIASLADRLEAAEAAHSALQRSYNTVDQQGRALVHENTRIEAELTRRDKVIGDARAFLNAALSEANADEADGGSGWDIEVDARTVLSILAAAPVSLEAVKAETADRRPHSRACGFRKHEHGADCNPNCQTCHGRSEANRG